MLTDVKAAPGPGLSLPIHDLTSSAFVSSSTCTACLSHKALKGSCTGSDKMFV